MGDPDSTTVGQQVTQLVDQWAIAELHGDAKALESLVAETFIGIGPRGFLLTKPVWLQRYKGGDLVNTAFSVDDMSVRVYGDAAVIVGQLTQQTAYKGHDTSGQFRVTLVWARQYGHWLLANLQLSPIAGPLWES